MTINFDMTVRKALVAIAASGLLMVGIWYGWRSVNGQPSPPAGSIMVPADLLEVYQPAAAKFEAAQKRIEEARKEADEVRPTIEQVLRITLDRAGVKVTDFSKYEYDPKLPGFKPAPTPVPPPTTR